MKHAGSNADFTQQREGAGAGPAPLARALGNPVPQSRTSVLAAVAFGLFLVAVLADGQVRALAQGLDPSVRTCLRFVTGFGNSAWPLGIGLALLGIVQLRLRHRTQGDAPDLLSLRSALTLLVSAVALSGVLASLSKHMIGRMRPSTAPDAEVLEFVFLAFRSGLASFPSGHATTATAAAVALALCFPRHAWGWLASGLVIALSRAFLGVHWFSDCLAGMLLGAVLTVALHRWMVAAGHQPQVAPGSLGRALAGTASDIGQLAAVAFRMLRAASLARLQPAVRRPGPPASPDRVA